MQSEHGHPLILSASPVEHATITVELYEKWYGLYIVDPHMDKPVMLPFTALEDAAQAGESAFCDHTPNPNVVVRWAEQRVCDVDPLALEMMIGRWELEYFNQSRRYRRPGEDA